MTKVNEFSGYIVLAQEFGVIPHSFHFEDYNEALEYLKYMLGLRSRYNKAIGCILNSKLEVLYKTEVGPDAES